MTAAASPSQLLRDMATRSRQTALGLPAQQEVQQLWTGVGFSVADVPYLAPMAEVNEILPVPHYTKMPGVKPWVKGVANVRGRLVPVIELSQFFGLAGRKRIRDQRILIVEIGDMLNGLLVDSVEGLQNFPVNEYNPAMPDHVPDRLKPYTSGSYSRYRLNLGVFSLHELVTSAEFLAVAS